MGIGSRLLRRHRSLRPACLVGFWVLRLLVAQVPMSAQEVVLHRFVSSSPDPGIERLLYLAAGIELEHAGISSTRTAGNENYILLTRYRRSHGALAVDYTLMAHDKADETLASTKTTIPLDRHLDTRVAETIGRLLVTAGIKAEPSPNAQIEGILPAPPAAPAQPSVPVEATKPPPSPALPASPTQETARAAPATPGPHQTPPAPVTPREGLAVRFDSTVSTAGVMFFGQLTQYFHYGVAGSTTAGMAWRTKKTGFGVAAKFSLVRAFNDLGVIGGALYLSTAGLNIHVGSVSGKPYRLSAELSGGAAFLTVVGTQKTQTKTAPYGDIGLDGVLPIGRHFSLGASLRFLTIFDKGLLIMAAMPAITVGIG